MLLEAFKNYVQRQNLLPKHSKLLIAVSGGVDSVVLFNLLNNMAPALDFKLAIAHINHSMRDNESDQDEQFCKALADKFKLKFFVTKLDKEIWNNPGNKQDIARTLRYRALEGWCTEYGYDFIVTAHHADDQAETIIDRLIRGSGLDGLSGIPEKRGNIVRPLLQFGKDQIIAYAKSQNLGWREDSSNSKKKYRRNKIRHDVIPMLKEISAKAVDNIVKSARLVADAKTAIDTQVEKFLEQNATAERNQTVQINIKDISKLPIAIRTAAYRKIFQQINGGSCWGISQLHCLEVDKLALDKIKSLSLSLPVQLGVTRQKDTLIFSSIEQEEVKPFDFLLEVPHIINLPFCSIETSYVKNNDLAQVMDESTVFFDMAKLYGKPKFRSRKQGDKMSLPNLGTKLVSKIISDLKCPKTLRNQIPLLVLDKEVLWIAGLRRSDKAKVDETTKKVLKIKYTQNN